jgi:hypothetical protein
MPAASRPRAPYVVPRYRAPGDPAFYHLLHGNVPGHEIDFIYCPAAPQGPLTQMHLGHAARLLKYIEPREKAGFAFAIGNLSRDDVQHVPGRGGLALFLCRRAQGVIDHAGRALPPYAHGLIAVDRALDRRTLAAAATAFHARFMDEGPPGTAGGFYQAYVRRMREAPGSVGRLLAEHIASFDDLPRPPRSELGADFLAAEGETPERLTIVIPDGEPFAAIAGAAAALASVLYRSNVKWTTISSGREAFIPGGVSIRLVPESETPRDVQGPVFLLGELPDDDAAIAEKLFHATPPRAAVPGRAGWREQYAKKTGHAPASAGVVPAALDTTPPAGIRGVADTGKLRWIFAGGGLAAAALAAVVAFSPKAGHEEHPDMGVPDAGPAPVPRPAPAPPAPVASRGGDETTTPQVPPPGPATGRPVQPPRPPAGPGPRRPPKARGVETAPPAPVTAAPAPPPRDPPSRSILDDPKY